MGGIWKMIPVTYALMWIGSLALGRCAAFAGYFSKDIVLEAAYARIQASAITHSGMGIAAALLTAFYSWRLLFMTFHGTPRCDETTLGHVHESPKVMLSRCWSWRMGAVGAGYVGYDLFVGEGSAILGRCDLDLDRRTRLR